MRHTFIHCLIFLVVLAGAGCKKTAVPASNAERPLQRILAEKNVVDTSVIFTNGSWEFGYKIYFSRNGSITKLGCKLGAPGNFRVAFWDFNAQNVIAVTTVTVSDTTQFAYNFISPVSVSANSRYLIAVNNTSGGLAKKYFVYSKKSNVAKATIYPFSAGSATIESSFGYLGSDLHFPTPDLANPYLSGIADLQFEPAD